MNSRKLREIPRNFHPNQKSERKRQIQLAKFCEILKKRCKGIEKWQKSEIHFDNLVDLENHSKMRKNEYLIAIVAVHTAENESSKV